MRGGWYSRNPLWKRLLFALVGGLASGPFILAGLAFYDLLVLGDFEGLSDAGFNRETWLILVGLLGTSCGVGFAILVYLFEFRWKRDPMWRMRRDDSEPDQHEPDLRG